ncbi:hypothetical protein L596_007794 [Steinernema carpocapsae]|uniref:Uncharacterized protein n=1 Tax=Steinernema carpocapsae TaxID=34508 RepID=A0A4U5PBH1_STECR|nr:hypothetical protein L596_007794 [Steinernema carpocapsae]
MLTHLPYSVAEHVCQFLSFEDLENLRTPHYGHLLPQLAREAQIRRHFANFFHVEFSSGTGIRMIAFRRYKKRKIYYESIDLENFSDLSIAAENSLVLNFPVAASTFSSSSSPQLIFNLVARISQISNLRLSLNVTESFQTNPLFHQLLTVLHLNLRSPSQLALASSKPTEPVVSCLDSLLQLGSLSHTILSLGSLNLERLLLEHVFESDWTFLRVDSELPYSFFEAVRAFWNSPKSRHLLGKKRAIRCSNVFCKTIKRNLDFDLRHPSNPSFVMRVARNYLDSGFSTSLHVMDISMEFCFVDEFVDLDVICKDIYCIINE